MIYSESSISRKNIQIITASYFAGIKFFNIWFSHMYLMTLSHHKTRRISKMEALAHEAVKPRQCQKSKSSKTIFMVILFLVDFKNDILKCCPGMNCNEYACLLKIVHIKKYFKKYN